MNGRLLGFTHSLSLRTSIDTGETRRERDSSYSSKRLSANPVSILLDVCDVAPSGMDPAYISPDSAIPVALTT